MLTGIDLVHLMIATYSLHVTQSLDDEVESLLVIAHPAE